MTWSVRNIAEYVSVALAEDIGSGDITTQTTVPQTVQALAVLRVKSPGTIAGLDIAEEVFRQVDPSLTISRNVEDGYTAEAGEDILSIRGSARSILTAERVALNFVQRMSGIATLTAEFVSLTVGTKARIVDTRKTTPGLRAIEKYAVRVGGGFNHRYGLYDAVLIKDNHIQACGSISEAVQAAFSAAPHTMTVTVECDTLEQVSEAVEAGADIVLVDNMDTESIREAVSIAEGQAAVEASGGITLSTVAEIAAAGVDIISVGALTHSVRAMDISLNLVRL